MELQEYRVLKVKKAIIGRLTIADEFFDSLRKSYSGFDDWLRRKANEYCYVSYHKVGSEFKLAAFLYLKIEGLDEDYSQIVPPLKPAKRLKIGTFKVSSQGERLGERFIKIICDAATAQGVDECYVTIFDSLPELRALIDVLTRWGFKYHGTKGEEQVLVKDMHYKGENLYECYPAIKVKRAFLCPIKPDYHTNLFPDSILNTESPLDFQESEAHKNGIVKSFVSRSIERSLKVGDLVVMYRTSFDGPAFYTSVLTTVCVVCEAPDFPSTLEDFKKACGNRTVFSKSELEKWWHEKPNSRPFVVSLLHSYSLPKRPNLEALIKNGIIKSTDDVPRGFSQISLNQLKSILTLSEADESRFVY